MEMDSTDSSEDGSFDSEGIVGRDFEAEKDLIVRDLLPKKSRAQYELAYAAFLKWIHDNKTTKITESVLVVNFKELSKKWKPSSLWSVWSKLRTTLSLRHSLNINEFHNLKTMLRNESKGFKPKQSLILSWSQIKQFLNSSEDSIYLSTKVILIFGIFGALRCQEFVGINTTDIEDTDNQYIVSIRDIKNDYPRSFVIGAELYNTVKKYSCLRPDIMPSNRFFVQYQNGKCTHQFIGKTKISETPRTIASYLNLDNPNNYTGHCFRRSAATALSSSGVNLTMVKQLGGWRSDAVAQRYIENSLTNRREIFKNIINSNQTEKINSTDKKLDAISSASKDDSSRMIKSDNKVQSNVIADETPCSTKNDSNLLAIPSTSKQNPNVILDWAGDDFFENDLEIQSSPIVIHQPIHENVDNNQNKNFSTPKSKKRRLMIDDNADQSSTPMFQNCVIHGLVVHNNYYYKSQENQ